MLLYVAHYADYFAPGLRPHGYVYALANRVFIREIALSHRLVYDDYARGVLRVMLCEYSPSQQRYAHRLEVIGCYAIVVRSRQVGILHACAALDNEAQHEV